MLRSRACAASSTGQRRCWSKAAARASCCADPCGLRRRLPNHRCRPLGRPGLLRCPRWPSTLAPWRFAGPTQPLPPGTGAAAACSPRATFRRARRCSWPGQSQGLKPQANRWSGPYAWPGGTQPALAAALPASPMVPRAKRCHFQSWLMRLWVQHQTSCQRLMATTVSPTCEGSSGQTVSPCRVGLASTGFRPSSTTAATVWGPAH
mmetsp:Transcript_115457/g.321675  ORF Transcript_115457/g.321675 Transcript_115457/m.321675 type:complete len:206 (-) Transcript_115457:136-753(-)